MSCRRTQRTAVPPLKLELAALRPPVYHSITEPLRSSSGPPLKKAMKHTLAGQCMVFLYLSHMRKSFIYCKFGNFREGFIFAKFLSFIDIGKSCPCRECICLSTLLAKIEFSRKFPNLQ